MILLTVLSIIDRSLEIALIIVKSLPPEHHAQFWQDWREDTAWVRALAKKLKPEDADA